MECTSPERVPSLDMVVRGRKVTVLFGPVTHILQILKSGELNGICLWIRANRVHLHHLVSKSIKQHPLLFVASKNHKDDKGWLLGASLYH